VLDVATRLGADRFAIVGWSMGAFVAMAAARQAAARIERLVLIDAIGPVTSLRPRPRRSRTTIGWASASFSRETRLAVRPGMATTSGRPS